MRSVHVFALLTVAASCIGSAAVHCPNGTVCATGTRCAVVDDQSLCVQQDQLDACVSVEQGEACGDGGTCHDGVCLPSECGNDRDDVDEICDDANQTDGDGCSARCDSLEVCGNTLVDLLAAETCDDGNFLDHDGCSSVCKSETRTWTTIGEPVARYDGAAVYDAARDKVVMFGGRTLNRLLFDVATTVVSEWDGVWRGEIVTPPAPARIGAALAYDFDRRRTVMYGGNDATSNPSGQTWFWDGVAWQQGPDGPPRAHHAMAYDARRKRLVVFGGQDADGNLLDSMLELDGASWQVIPLSSSPGGRANADMVYDPKRGVIVMLGGGVSSDPAGAVWEYDGTTWSMRTPSGAAPPYRSGMAVTYEPVSGHIVLFGGVGSPDPVDDMWIYDGVSWTEYMGTTPPARMNALLVPDGRGRVMLFGGRTVGVLVGGGVLGDTWFFDGDTWTLAEARPARSLVSVAAAFDHGKILHHGGHDSDGIWSSETWERTRMGWTRLPTTLPVLQYTGLVYDSARQQFLVFGGLQAGDVADSKLWQRSVTGTTWTSVEPTPSPPPRHAHMMVFDGARGKTLIYGGLDAAQTILSDMWSWDGAAWTALSPAQLPTQRAAGVVGYDPIHQVVILFGGQDADGEPVNRTWAWDGTTWHDVTPASSPEPVILASLVWNPARRSLVLAGPGFTFSPGSFETWEWVGAPTSPPSGTWRRIATLTSPSPRAASNTAPQLDGAGVEVSFGFGSMGTAADTLELVDRGPRAGDSCRIQIDVDGDGLVGCPDGDCWSLCAPLCPPGAPCPASSPRCGDGDCSAIESHHSCPMDCTTLVSTCGDFVCDPSESCPGDCL